MAFEDVGKSYGRMSAIRLRDYGGSGLFYLSAASCAGGDKGVEGGNFSGSELFNGAAQHKRILVVSHFSTHTRLCPKKGS